MENVLAECKAYDAATTCDEKNIRLEKLKIKTRKASIFLKEKICTVEKNVLREGGT